MKKSNLVLPVAALLLAVFASFAFRSDDIVKWKVPPSTVCEVQTECTLTMGNPCQYATFDEGCSPIELFKP